MQRFADIFREISRRGVGYYHVFFTLSPFLSLSLSLSLFLSYVLLLLSVSLSERRPILVPRWRIGPSVLVNEPISAISVLIVNV